MNVSWLVLVAFVAGVPACRPGAPAQTPADLAARGDGVRAGVDAGQPDPDIPPAADSDGDGIPDRDEACPSDPEDLDNFEDKDGCPEPDNDHDRIADLNDKCPNDPESYNGLDDEDGCPDVYRSRSVPRPQSAIKEGAIAFDDNSAAIRRDTAAILDSIVVFIHDRPGISQVTIAGYAEAYERHPPALAAARVEAVRSYLTKRGVPATMFAPAWRPNDDGGRSRRRVDLEVEVPR